METGVDQTAFCDMTLVILEQGNIRNFKFGEGTQWTLGRVTPQNNPDIPLFSPIAGRLHGRFLFVDRELFYCDLGSRNGTFYNGIKISSGIGKRVSPIMLKNGDVLRIDYENFDTPDSRGVWMLITSEALQDEWTFLSLKGNDHIVIGRDKTRCDIVISLPHVSLQHAVIKFLNGNYYISDCDSDVGTWVNGEKIHNTKALKEKDQIYICNCHIIFTGNKLIYNQQQSEQNEIQEKKVVLRADIISKKVRNQNGYGYKELIRDIHLELFIGDLIALLGESGTGKSTLMNCLNGVDQSGVEGKILFQGEELYRHYDRLKYFIGNVPQTNVLHEVLTVEEELKNAAQLRLPKDCKKKEIMEQVESTLNVLKLLPKRHTQINKLSGGEKKRVNIGIELVANRKFLCLDEPDAGLDPPAKRELFRILKKLTRDQEKTVIAIIHDVSEIDYFDQVIMMSKLGDVGRLAFMGTPKQAKEHFHVEKLSDAYEINNISRTGTDVNYELVSYRDL